MVSTGSLFIAARRENNRSRRRKVFFIFLGFIVALSEMRRRQIIKNDSLDSSDGQK